MDEEKILTGQKESHRRRLIKTPEIGKITLEAAPEKIGGSYRRVNGFGVAPFEFPNILEFRDFPNLLSFLIPCFF